jgi:hypothetical protein
MALHQDALANLTGRVSAGYLPGGVSGTQSPASRYVMHISAIE